MTRTSTRVPGGSGHQVFVTGNGRGDFLAEGYRLTSDGELDHFYRITNLWVQAWIPVALAALAAVAADRVHRGVSRPRGVPTGSRFR